MNEFLRKQHIITEIVTAILVCKGQGVSIHKNRPSHGLALNLKGQKKYVFDNGTVCTVKENDIIYLPKNSNYEVNDEISGDIYCINFQCLDEETFSPFVIHLINAEETLKAYQNAEKAWIRAKDGREYKVLSELYKILYELRRIERMHYLPETKQALLKPALDYIHKHYTEELISVEKLSTLCGISHSYLRKLFEKFYGTSPIKYINALKIKRTKELLSSGLYSVSESALQAGFFDLSYFSRFFKKNVGVSPKEYLTQI